MNDTTTATIGKELCIENLASAGSKPAARTIPTPETALAISPRVAVAFPTLLL